ncbi:MAG: hypothetical protein EOP45_01415 [Sphingobacteriaceae bacterium]|nr:MAG: hypothetical protein EOP45_01415 [Sphingobacteriaceae bacterium]
MTAYLINTTLCSALLLLAYVLLLRNRSIYGFNRFYLLVSVFFSLTVPLIVVEQKAAPVPNLTGLQNSIIIIEDTGRNQPPVNGTKSSKPSISNHNQDYSSYFFLIIYIIVSGLLLCRFVVNLYTVWLVVQKNQKVDYQGSVLVLIAEKQVPHTFLGNIFLNKWQYDERMIDDAILSHELAHARQLHSIDVILIEFVQIFFWFNPFILLYRKVVKVNHEFLADQAVINAEYYVPAYQHLLIRQITQPGSLAITSQLGYSVTKKRFIMMTKTTSPAFAWLSRLSVVPVLIIAFMLFCIKTEAFQQQQKPYQRKAPAEKIKDTQASKSTNQSATQQRTGFMKSNYPFTKEGVSQALLNEYGVITAKYVTSEADVVGKLKPKVSLNDKSRLDQIFRQMSRPQQQQQIIGFSFPPPPLPRVIPTQAQLNSWKNPHGFGLWIDQKHVANSELENKSPQDFGSVFVSHLSPNALHYHQYHYQVDLMTTDAYNKYRSQAVKNQHVGWLYYRFSDASQTRIHMGY